MLGTNRLGFVTRRVLRRQGHHVHALQVGGNDDVFAREPMSGGNSQGRRNLGKGHRLDAGCVNLVCRHRDVELVGGDQSRITDEAATWTQVANSLPAVGRARML